MGKAVRAMKKLMGLCDEPELEGCGPKQGTLTSFDEPEVTEIPTRGMVCLIPTLFSRHVGVITVGLLCMNGGYW